MYVYLPLPQKIILIALGVEQSDIFCGEMRFSKSCVRSHEFAISDYSFLKPDFDSVTVSRNEKGTIFRELDGKPLQRYLYKLDGSLNMKDFCIWVASVN